MGILSNSLHKCFFKPTRPSVSSYSEQRLVRGLFNKTRIDEEMEIKMQRVVAFVTGGASGIGRATIESIVNHGGKAVIVDLNIDGEKLAETLGENSTFVQADVTSEEDIKRALEHAKQRFGGINVVMNCAGVALFHVPYDFEAETAYPLEIYKKVMDVNALGTFNVTRLAAGVMAANVPDENQQRGVIINIASIMVDDSPDSLLAYAASKAAVRGMSIPFARCFAQKGIRVVTISPGFTSTPMASDVENNPIIFSKITELSLLSPKHFASAAEVAHLARCIIENSYINAVDMKISAGYSYSKNLLSA